MNSGFSSYMTRVNIMFALRKCWVSPPPLMHLCHDNFFLLVFFLRLIIDRRGFIISLIRTS